MNWLNWKASTGVTRMESQGGDPLGCTWKPVVVTQIGENDASDQDVSRLTKPFLQWILWVFMKTLVRIVKQITLNIFIYEYLKLI